MDFSANSCHVLLLELTANVTLHEGRLADTAIANQNKLEVRNLCGTTNWTYTWNVNNGWRRQTYVHKTGRRNQSNSYFFS